MLSIILVISSYNPSTVNGPASDTGRMVDSVNLQLEIENGEGRLYIVELVDKVALNVLISAPSAKMVTKQGIQLIYNLNNFVMWFINR